MRTNFHPTTPNAVFLYESQNKIQRIENEKLQEKARLEKLLGGQLPTDAKEIENLLAKIPPATPQYGRTDQTQQGGDPTETLLRERRADLQTALALAKGQSVPKETAQAFYDKHDPAGQLRSARRIDQTYREKIDGKNASDLVRNPNLINSLESQGKINSTLAKNLRKEWELLNSGTNSTANSNLPDDVVAARNYQHNQAKNSPDQKRFDLNTQIDSSLQEKYQRQLDAAKPFDPVEGVPVYRTPGQGGAGTYYGTMSPGNIRSGDQPPGVGDGVPLDHDIDYNLHRWADKEREKGRMSMADFKDFKNKLFSKSNEDLKSALSTSIPAVRDAIYNILSARKVQDVTYPAHIAKPKPGEKPREDTKPQAPAKPAVQATPSSEPAKPSKSVWTFASEAIRDQWLKNTGGQYTIDNTKIDPSLSLPSVPPPQKKKSKRSSAANPPATTNPLDKIDQIAQARDAATAAKSTPATLASGGVKLSKAQRAESRTKKDYGGLQFRVIDGQVQVVGGPPKDSADSKKSQPSTGMR